jgi:hypothetical protein
MDPWGFLAAVFNSWVQLAGVVLTIIPFIEKIPRVKKLTRDKPILDVFRPLIWLIGLSCILFGFYSAWHEEHQKAAARDDTISQLKSDIRDLESRPETAGSAAARVVIEELNTKLHRAEGEVNELQLKLSILGKPQCWHGEGHRVSAPGWTDLEPIPTGRTINDVKLATEFAVWCNFRIPAPWQVIMDFDKKVEGSSVGVDGIGYMSGGSRIIDPRLRDNQFATQVSHPPLGVYSPFFITVHSVGYIHAVKLSVRPQ